MSICRSLGLWQHFVVQLANTLVLELHPFQCPQGEKVVGSNTLGMTSGAVLSDTLEHLHAALKPPFTSKCSGAAVLSLVAEMGHAVVQLVGEQLVAAEVLLDQRSILEQMLLGLVEVLLTMLPSLEPAKVHRGTLQMPPHGQDARINPYVVEDIVCHRVRPQKLVLHGQAGATAHRHTPMYQPP